MSLKTLIFQAELDKESKTPLYLQIAQLIIDEIKRGRLWPGNKLPSTRSLSEYFMVNRKTVIDAYAELIAQGWLFSLNNRGTYVSTQLPFMGQELEEDLLADVLKIKSNSNNSVASKPKNAVINTNLLRLNDGLPDTRLFPAEIYLKVYRKTLLLATKNGSLNYADPQGSMQLRTILCSVLNVDRGLSAKDDNICITRGSQMALFLVAKTLISRGDCVIFEELTYSAARDVFALAGATIVYVKLDDDGLDIEHLEQLCRLNPIKAIYVTPGHQFPTTVTLKLDRRLALLSLSRKYNFTIIEDDYDHEFHFEHKPYLPLASFSPDNVIYIGSLSKLLAPNLRLGYVVATKKVIAHITSEVLMIDRQGDQIAEMVIAQLFADGTVRRFSRKALGLYRERRDYFAEKVLQELGEFVHFKTPQGGLAFWLILRNEQQLKLLEKNSFNVQFPVAHCCSSPQSKNCGIRVGFASMNQSELDNMIKHLRKVLIETCNRPIYF